jgi:hypothetical protein
LARASFEPDPAPPAVGGERTALKPRSFLPIVTVNAAATAVNGAVEEFNKFAADIKAQDEAAKN